MDSENKNSVPAQELELIGKYARKALTQEEIYTFSVILCDNEIDRDNEKFTVASLNTLAELFVGKTGIFDHNMSSKDQTARVYATRVVTDETRKTSDGEPYTYIEAKAYMVRTEKNKDLIAEIDAGIKKETSVGCAVKVTRCSVCGENVRSTGCEHQKGKKYGGKICCHLLEEPADAYEWSFVAVPAQKNAGVIKSFSPEAHTAANESWAEEYRAELKAALIRDAATVMPEMGGEALEEICKELSLARLKDMRDAFRKKAEKKLSFIRQLDANCNTEAESNSEYKI